MAWDEDHLAQGVRHTSEEAWVSFKTLATEDAGIPSRLAVMSSTYSSPLPLGRIPTPMRDEGEQAPRVP